MDTYRLCCSPTGPVCRNLPMNRLSTCSMGETPRLPIERVLCPAKVRTEIDLKEYGQDLTLKMSQARQSVKKAQKYEKTV